MANKLLPYARNRRVLHSLIQHNDSAWYVKALAKFTRKYLDLTKTTNHVFAIASKQTELIAEHVKSIEFNHVLDVPPDFHIETSLKNLHLWLVLNRLRDFSDSSTASTLEIYLNRVFKEYVEKSINQIHIHRKSNFIADTNYFLETTRKVLSFHFRENKDTVNSPMHKIDALVWTNIFYEKVDRYDRRVYIIASYLLENYRYMKTRSLEDIKNCNVQWNAFAMPVDYREQIELANPPLSPEEYRAERDKPDNQEKRYRYDYAGETPIVLNDEYSVIERRKDRLLKKLRYVFRKYDDLDVMDYSFEKEAEYEQRTKDRQKYAWVNTKGAEVAKTNELLSSEKIRELRDRVKSSRN